MPSCEKGAHLYGRGNRCIFCLDPMPAETAGVETALAAKMWHTDPAPVDEIGFAFWIGFVFGMGILAGVFGLFHLIEKSSL